jgi:hypothetical protein
MSTHNKLGGSQGTGRNESEADRPQFICTACQRPIEDGKRSDWRGEPVHFECGAELRCGVSLGGSRSE